MGNQLRAFLTPIESASVSRGFRKVLNCAPIMAREASLSGSNAILSVNKFQINFMSVMNTL